MKNLAAMFKKDFVFAITSEHVQDNAVIAATEVLTVIRGFVFLPFIIKKFGIYDYGIWVQCGILSNMMATLAGFNLHTYIVRHVAEEDDAAERGCAFFSDLLLLIALNTALMLAFAAVFLVVDIGRVFLDDSGATTYLTVAILAVPFMALQTYNLSFFRAIQRLRLQGILSLILGSLELLFVLLSLTFGGLMEALWTILVWRGVASVTIAGIIVAQNRRTRPQFSRMLDSLRFSLPLVAANMSAFALKHADKILIGGFFGTATLGLYSVASKLGSVPLCLLSPFNSTLLPKMSKKWKHDESAARRIVKRYANFFLLAAIPVVTFSIFFGNDLLKIFSKKEIVTSQTYATFVCVSLANLFWGLSVFESYLLYGAKKTKTVASLRMITAILYLFLNYFLLRMVGFEVAGINLLLSHVVLYYAYRKCGNDLKLRPLFLCFCLITSLSTCLFILRVKSGIFGAMTLVTTGFLYLLTYSLIIYAGSIFLRKYGAMDQK